MGHAITRLDGCPPFLDKFFEILERKKVLNSTRRHLIVLD